MNTYFLPENTFKTSTDELRPETNLVYFKLVSVGNETRLKLNKDKVAISDAVSAITGHYIFSFNFKDLREAMHKYVDDMVNALEKQS